MEFLLRLSRNIDRLNERIGRSAYWLTLVMVGVGSWNVFGRYVGRAVGQNLSSNALLEIQWYLFDLVFLLGAAYTLKHNNHVRVDVIQSRLTPKQKAWVDLVGSLLFLIPFCTMILFYSTGSVVNSWKLLENSPDPGGLVRYPIKTMILVSFGLLILQGISQAIKNLDFVFNPSDKTDE
ncbi:MULTISPECIES: TRAP transporter small permease subunit [unclassified Roseofilum]|uniref:TRAP transporter small permease subunit n=1 Tax=unclassified Roseofilum TaxID=2620099 RepID=UPI000E86365A|nr:MULTISPECIES: TRAP transporter small permease subunit [unclassified Roseofilum]HBR00038.1 C4-dicarboxylate ABC transporter substrate-binding protein [Cyanobacteria bacterium UBA11691]MBP0010613.1 TRAP transporter small permease subunit [Roseofilum sp. Belize Diploria]MBP0013146.1 TRAP transporter small permease subunit [Roseofilum sp. SID3]MBP0026456.1 TRAP transporter small permease subunit [Roseofilum sp. SID2]MBP0035103.1 TRAP transporter small permease subunit [Roseofilum sp. Belize BBD